MCSLYVVTYFTHHCQKEDNGLDWPGSESAQPVLPLPAWKVVAHHPSALNDLTNSLQKLQGRGETQFPRTISNKDALSSWTNVTLQQPKLSWQELCWGNAQVPSCQNAGWRHDVFVSYQNIFRKVNQWQINLSLTLVKKNMTWERHLAWEESASRAEDFFHGKVLNKGMYYLHRVK